MDPRKTKSNKFNIYKKSTAPKYQKFPSLYSANNYNHRNSQPKRKKLNRSSSSFYQRNYTNYLEKINNKNNSINSSLLRQSDLSTLLYKLKNYDNQIMTYSNEKKKAIKVLEDLLKVKEFKLNKLQELQDIDLPDEKISVKNFNELKMSKVDIEKKLNFFLKAKEEISYSLKNEIEYNKTVEYMFEDEQTRLEDIKKNIHIAEDKLKNIAKYQRIINDNLKKTSIKQGNFSELNTKIQKDMTLIDKVYSKQKYDSGKLDIEIDDKEHEIRLLEEQVVKLKEYNSHDLLTYKEDIKNEIEEAKEKEKLKRSTEKKYIEIIYCLYIIQKYFINELNYDKEKLLNSNDYKVLVTNNILDLVEENNNIDISEINDNNNIKMANKTSNNFYRKISRTVSEKSKNSKNKKNRNFSGISVKKTEITDLHDKSSYTNNKLTNNNRSYSSIKKNNVNSEKSRVYFDELCDKFNEINLTKEMLFNYNATLTSKLNFLKNNLDRYHSKEIELENQKDNYDKEVKNIIQNNYYLFEELTKFNKQCKEYLNKNKSFIKQVKKKSKKEKYEKIIEELTIKDKDKEKDLDLDLDIDTENIEEEEKEENNIEDNEILFKSSENIILMIKQFFIIILDISKEIILSINYINNYTINQSNNLNNINNENNNENTIQNPKRFSLPKYANVNNANEDSDFLKENNIITEYKSDPNKLIYINKYISIYKKLSSFLKNKNINITDDPKNLINYIKNLIDFVENDPLLKNSMDIDELNKDLLDKFYTSEKIDKLFYQRFLSKENINYNNIFEHFTTLKDSAISNIKNIYKLVEENSSKSNKNIYEIIQTKNEIISKINTVNNTSYSRKIHKTSFDRNINENKKNKTNNKILSDELIYDDEDTDTFDTQSTKHKKKIVKKKVKSVDEKVINSLYNPFLEKTAYLRKLNKNIPLIKHMSTSNAKINHDVKKMREEIDNMTYQMIVYNNPKLDPNRLCDDTYKSLISLMVNNKKKENNEKEGDKKKNVKSSRK